MLKYQSVDTTYQFLQNGVLCITAAKGLSSVLLIFTQEAVDLHINTKTMLLMHGG